MTAVVACNDLEKQEVISNEDGVDNLSIAQGDATIDKSGASVEKHTHIDRDFDRSQNWLYIQTGKHFNLPVLLLLDLTLAALVGTIISISSNNSNHDTDEGTIAWIWWYCFVWSASTTGFLFVPLSVISASWRMKIDGRQRLNGRDMRILAQDLLYALLWDIITSLLMTGAMWALWVALI